MGGYSDDSFAFGLCYKKKYDGVIVRKTPKPCDCDSYLNRWVVRHFCANQNQNHT